MKTYINITCIRKMAAAAVFAIVECGFSLAYTFGKGVSAGRQL